jgi:hypothetical protein
MIKFFILKKNNFLYHVCNNYMSIFFTFINVKLSKFRLIKYDKIINTPSRTY